MVLTDSYIMRLRQKVGSQLLLNPGGRAIVQNHSGEILFHKRSDFNFWDLPSGGAEAGESAEQCIIRELYEETGLIAESFEAIGFASDPERELVTYPNGDIVQGFALILYIDRWSGNLQTSTESTAIKFFAINNLPEMRQNIRLTIDKFFDYQKSGKFQLF